MMVCHECIPPASKNKYLDVNTGGGDAGKVWGLMIVIHTPPSKKLKPESQADV